MESFSNLDKGKQALFFAAAYQRMAVDLLDPFETDPAVDRFMVGNMEIAKGPGCDEADIQALGATSSWIVPAVAIKVFHAARNDPVAGRVQSLFIRKYRTSSQPTQSVSTVARETAAREDAAWQTHDIALRVGPSRDFPPVVALPRGIDSRIWPSESNLRVTSMQDYFGRGCRLTVTNEHLREEWQQLCGATYHPAETELRNGTPSSPLITYYRLRVLDQNTRLVTSAVFRCVVVEDDIHGTNRFRSWKFDDGVAHFPPLRESIAQAFCQSSDRSTRQHSHEAHLHPHDLSDVRLPPLRLRSDSAHGQHHYALGHRQRRIYGQSHARSAL